MMYPSLDAFRQVLEQRLAHQSRDTGTDLNRLRRRVVYERILARLVTSQPDMWILKGGMSIELRIGDVARMTKDLDLNLRLNTDVASGVHEQLSAALANDSASA